MENTIRISELPNSVFNPDLLIPCELPGGQTVHVRAGDLIPTTSGAGNALPRVEVEVIKGVAQDAGSYKVFSLPQLRVWFAGFYGLDWLEQEPEIWLFRQRPFKRDKAGMGRLKRRRPSAWVHPTDYRWMTRHATSKLYRGESRFAISSPGQVTLQRVTEWPCPTEPYVKQLLEDFDPTLYFQIEGSLFTLGALPVAFSLDNVKPMNTRTSKWRSRRFCDYIHFRIAVKNTDPSNPAEYIFGPPSQTVRMAPLVHKQQFDGTLTIAGLRCQVL